MNVTAVASRDASDGKTGCVGAVVLQDILALPFEIMFEDDSLFLREWEHRSTKRPS
jgi:hypothetical protein